MKKLILLLIPLLFLSSCTIDWNDEKDKKIAELEKELNSTKALNKITILPESSGFTIPKSTPVDSWSTTTGEKLERVFARDFHLSQTNDNTTLLYKGKILKTWIHPIAKEAPIIMDSACDITIQKKTHGDKEKDIQYGWSTLTNDEKKSCMKEYLKDNISVEATSYTWFFLIQEWWYEGSQKWLFHDEDSFISDLAFDGLIQKIEVWASGTYILSGEWRWNDGWVLLITPKNIVRRIFCNTDDEKSITTTDFELLSDKKIRVKYLENKLPKEKTFSL